MSTKKNTIKPQFQRSFFIRLFVMYLLILLFSLGTVILIWSNNIVDTASTLSSSNIKDVFSIANSKFNTDLDSLYNTMNVIASNNATTNYLKNPSEQNARRLHTYLDDCSSLSYKSIKGIALMTEDDFVFGGYSYFSPKYKEFSWYQMISVSDGSNILFNRSETVSSRSASATKPLKLSIGKAIKENGQTIGILICEIDTSFILNLYGISTINNSLRTIILDENENVLFSNNRVSEGEYLNDIIEISEYRKYNNTFHTVSLNNHKYTMISQKLNATPGWVNITYLPQANLYRNYRDSLKFALMCASVILLISAILSYALLHFWRARLNKLCHYIEKIDITVPSSAEQPKLSERRDEIGHIYERVSEMVHIMISQLQTISQLEEKKHHYEIQMLKAQINPHMIYNTLNTIQVLARLQKNIRIDKIAGSLSNLLLYSTADIDNLVSLSCELQHVKEYLDIMQNKFLNDISFVQDIDNEVKDCQMLKVLLQPIVENSIKHGFIDAPGNYIMIKAYRDEDNVLIRIIDNGKGIPEEKQSFLLTDSPDTDGHLGLKNVDRRIKLTFGKKYGLNILSIPKVQTTVLISIPYIS